MAQHHLGTAQFLERLGDVTRGRIDVVVGAEVGGVLRLARPAGDRDGLEAHRPCPLDAQVPQPADAQHRHPVTADGPGVSQRVVGGHTRAAHRGGLGERQSVGNPGQGRRRGGDRLRVAAGVVPAGHLQVHALHELTLATRHAVVAVAAEPADRDPLTDREPVHPGAQCGDRACHLVTGGDRPAEVGKRSGDEGVVGAADTAGVDVDADVAGRRRGGLHVHEFEGLSGGFHVDSAVGRHPFSSVRSQRVFYPYLPRPAQTYDPRKTGRARS